MNKIENGISIIGRLFIGAVYIFAGFIKVVEPLENFRGAIRAYDLVPEIFVVPIALLLPWLELILGVFLITGFLTRFSALMLSLISLSFFSLIGITYLVHGSLPTSCGCFGAGEFHLSTNQVVIMDGFNFLLGLKLFTIREHPLSLDKSLKSAP